MTHASWVVLKNTSWGVQGGCPGAGSLGGGELGDRLGALRHGVLGQLAGQDEAHCRLDLPGGHGRLQSNNFASETKLQQISWVNMHSEGMGRSKVRAQEHSACDRQFPCKACGKAEWAQRLFNAGQHSLAQNQAHTFLV